MKRMLLHAYRLLPMPLRQMLRRLGPAARFRQRHFEGDTSLHDEYYTKEYYEDIDPLQREAPAMCRAMIDYFGPADVLDVGCGSGDYLAAFRDAGIPGRGVELAAAALEICRRKGLDVVRLDLTQATELPGTADLVYSFEVAEHIPERSAIGFVRALTVAARQHVCLTAAQPGQPGLCHVNCQPKSYWVRLFAERGFVFDEALTSRLEAENTKAGLVSYLCKNLMIFHGPAQRRD